ncbi:hypothetical protein BT96DRAFT_975455 [Gymnopus androsaceus JB14]|uniref:CHAT domain-containing protein n=1 Tax=Gymnopus androsaceus JB14 TaxID=1447944 RepID=A0A6A4HU17_9AGAR|nr:hypothetical protein BT96DRAFT_975455 [Gymnopus androsaceus JB14]
MVLKEAGEFIPDYHADKVAYLSSLGNAFQARFERLGEILDIEGAIVAFKQAIELTPDGYAGKSSQLHNLGAAFQLRYGHSQNTIDLDSALSAFQRASLLSSGEPHVQLEAAIRWSKLCSTPALALQAYTRFFELNPQAVWLGKTAKHGYAELRRAIGAAAGTAISAGNLPLAVDWLDEGHSIIWEQTLLLHSPLDALHDNHPQIAKELEIVTQALQNAGTSNKNEFLDSEIKEETVEEEAQKHRRLASPLSFLPLHAAGIYGLAERNINVSDFVVSSYTTTLSALIGSFPKLKQHQAKIPTVLIVSQPNTPGLTPLPGTVEEAKVIQKYISNTHTCHLNHDAATAKAVMHEMSKYDFIHFACHGIQDIQDPFDSAFALYDRRLRLKALISLPLNNVQLAVLSACQTATRDQNLPEEAVLLAAGMLAVGYPSVIATLWSIGEKDAPLFADKLYANLLGHNDNFGEQKQKMSPAYALHEATKNLRKEVGETNFVKWVPFIHLGGA